MPQSEFQAKVAKALVASKAVDFAKAAAVIGEHAGEAAQAGESIGIVVTWRQIDLCIPPDPYAHATDAVSTLQAQVAELQQQVARGHR